MTCSGRWNKVSFSFSVYVYNIILSWLWYHILMYHNIPNETALRVTSSCLAIGQMKNETKCKWMANLMLKYMASIYNLNLAQPHIHNITTYINITCCCCYCCCVVLCWCSVLFTIYNFKAHREMSITSFLNILYIFL